MAPALRSCIEDAIERLVALLDKLDGDPDFEPDLGSPGTAPAYGSEVTDDREGDDERDCDLAGGSSDLEHDPALSGDTNWSDDTDIPQEGWAWSFQGGFAGLEKHRNPQCHRA